MGEAPYSSHTKSPDFSGFFDIVTYISLSVMKSSLKRIAC